MTENVGEPIGTKMPLVDFACLTEHDFEALHNLPEALLTSSLIEHLNYALHAANGPFARMELAKGVAQVAQVWACKLFADELDRQCPRGGLPVGPVLEVVRLPMP